LDVYIKIFTKPDSLILHSTMKSFETLLPKERFLRIHKSYIVNLAKVLGYNSKFIELEKHQIPLSRKRKPELIEALKNLCFASNYQHQ